MVEADVTICNPSGLHLRPTGVLCNEAIRYKSSIRFLHGNASGNVKSMLSVLAACIKSGSCIHLICEGPDEKEALAAMTALIESGLGESLQEGEGRKPQKT